MAGWLQADGLERTPEEEEHLLSSGRSVDEAREEPLLPGERAASASRRSATLFHLLIGALGLAIVGAVAAQYARPRDAPVKLLTAEMAASAEEFRQAGIGQQQEGQRAISSEESQQHFDARRSLALEDDLSALVSAAHLPRGAEPGADRSQQQRAAGVLFDHVVDHSRLRDELTGAERTAFRERFVGRMASRATADTSAYVTAAQEALESQKPVVTDSLARSFNDAKLGFRAEMRSWMVDESKERFSRRMGRKPMPEDRASLPPRQTSAVDLPEEFDARQKPEWSVCKEVIERIHDQGACGACWSFAALGPLDSRLCIATLGAAEVFTGNLAKLSRGYATSCFADPGEGCEGGWEYQVYDAIEADVGVPTDSCSPYFAGPGSEFVDSIEAPECPEDCRPEFPREIEQDFFKPSGVGDYAVFLNPDPSEIELMKIAIYTGGPVSFGLFANTSLLLYSGGIFDLDCGAAQANHAVQAIGWGIDYVVAQNSWGPLWGEGGRFRAAWCVLTDFTIPGDIWTANYPLPIPPIPDEDNTDNSTDSTPATNDSETPATTPAPTPAPSPTANECHVDWRGCVTSPMWPSNYPANSSCLISRGRFRRIDVKAFDTEEFHDFLLVNGKKYSGKQGPDGVVPVRDILWSSDDSEQRKGWKICPGSSAAARQGSRPPVAALVLAASVAWRALA